MNNKKRFKKLLLVGIALVLSLAMGLTVLAEGVPADSEPVAATEENSAPVDTADTDNEQVAEAASEPPAPEEEAAVGEDATAAEEGPETDVTENDAVEEAQPADNAEVTEETGEITEETGEEELEAEIEEEIEEETKEETAEPEPYGMVLDATSIVVYSYDELKTALEQDNGYTTIYLGADIAGTNSGIKINTNKPQVVIDGSPPEGGRYRFTQYRSSSSSATIQVASATVQTVTVRNMDITGSNQLGVVYVPESVKGVVLVQENVAYTGPQAFNNRGGTVRILGGSYNLGPVTGVATEELAEAIHVELGGELTISNMPSSSNGLVWLVDSASTLTFLKNANVVANTNYYFLYTSGHIPNVTMKPGAGFTYTTKRFGFTYGDQRVGNFIMETGSRLHIDHNTAESYAALRVAYLFQMEPGSSATILRTGTAGIPLRLTNANAKAVFNQPERVFLYSTAGVPLRFTGAGSLSITTTAINVWNNTNWPLAGGLATLPSHVWNKAGSELLTLTGRYNETTNQSLTHNLSDNDPVVSTLNSTHFSLEKNQLVAFGALPLAIDPPIAGDNTITGSTAPGADLLAAYTLETNLTGQAGGSADGAGRYSLAIDGGALLQNSTVTMLAQSNGLVARQTAVVDIERSLSFLSVPRQLAFGAVPVPEEQTLVNRQDTVFEMRVADTRANPSPWRIDASLSSPLTAEIDGGQNQLANAVVYKASGGNPVALNDEPTTVYRESSGQPGEYGVQWGSDEGILLSLFPGAVYSDVEYSATIHWELVDAP